MAAGIASAPELLDIDQWFAKRPRYAAAWERFAFPQMPESPHRSMNAADQLLLGGDALVHRAGRTLFECGDTQLSHGAFAEQVVRASGALRALGVRPGERVLLLMRDTPDYAAAWLGTVHAGAVAVGLNNKIAEVDFRHVLADSDARLVIVEDVFARARADLTAALAKAGRIALAGAAGDWNAPDWHTALASAAPRAPSVPVDADHPAFWLYSSGTTGRPKGIEHRHGDLLHAGQMQREVLGLGAGDRVLVTSKLFFAYALEMGFIGPLALGASVVLAPDWPEPAAIAALVARHAPTAFFSVPSFYRRLLELSPAMLAPFSAVRHFTSAGERLPATVSEAWRLATGRDVVSVYGMSETFCVCMADAPLERVEGGRLLRGVEARLLTAQGAEPAQGEPGVLWVRHPAQARAYVGRPEASREQFVDGWFCSRDVFVRDAAGRYCHRGRADEFIKVAGQWVQPGEVDEALSGLEAIADSACVAVTDADGFERLALFIVARGPGQRALDAAQRACEERLPRFKRPKWVRMLDALPRTATGKMQRFRLREMLEGELRDAD